MGGQVVVLKLCSFTFYMMGLISRFVLLVVVACSSYMANAQFVSERSAIHNIEKRKWLKARNQLTRILKKDSTHAGAEFAWSRYFFAESNPDFQIDSAYTHIQQARAYYPRATDKEREKLLKVPVDSSVLVAYKQRIDSAAFARARIANTEAAYVDFIKRFETALQKDKAIALRDSVAFEDTSLENTYQSFLTYIEKYPESRFASEAKIRYERLLFESKTADQKLATFESFLTQYPETPYRNEIERQIFEKITADGEAASFERFIRKYPASRSTKIAKDILYHLLKEEERALMSVLVSDSIRQVQILEKQFLVPFLKDDTFGFMNERGEELIKAFAVDIPDEYRCGNITDEVLIADGRIITRSGALLAKTKAREIQSLGYGFLLLENGACVNLMHVSGFFPVAHECLQDVKLLAKNFILLKKNNRWSIWTLTGRQLIPYEWEEIHLFGEAIVLKKNAKSRLIRIKDLAKIADQQQPVFSKEYDDVKHWNTGMMCIKNGSEEGVLTQSLKEWIKPAHQKITQAFFGAICETTAGYVLYDMRSSPSTYYYNVKVQQPWILVQQAGVWYNVDLVTKKNVSAAFDSVGFVGPFFAGIRKDTLQIHMREGATLELPQKSRIQFLPGKDSLFFLLVDEPERKVVYNAKAHKLFSVQAERIEYNNENHFTITQKQKKGLVSIDGRIALKPEYDALGTVTQGTVATLKDKKFGLVDLTRKREIKPGYDKNITVYNTGMLVVVKNNLSALIDWDNKLVTPVAFEEINYWNDSSAWVKRNFQWMLYNFIEKVVTDKIKAYKWVNNTPQEKIMIVQQENKYGVLSNTRGVIIPATFSDIVNVGSSTQPLYFTEKHVEEASIFVVIYYDGNGVQLKKYVYEGSDYEKIYCSGK